MDRTQTPALFTDLYELTMAASYFEHHMSKPATFSLFARTIPACRGFLVGAGMAEVIAFLQSFAFSGQDIAFLRESRRFADEFLDYLATLRFTGEVYGPAEGHLCFANEPLLEVTAPIIQAQLIETYVVNAIHLQTLIATKALRCVHAANGRSVIDFSLRRTHGTDAGMKAARASYLAGFDGTSNVLAGQWYGMPYLGTMAHSYVQSFDREEDAFRAYAHTFPNDTALLIDTYDTVSGAHLAAKIGRELHDRGHRLRGVRLDSGDLLALSLATRAILDEAGLPYARIYASGGLNEYKIAALVAAGAPIEVFGVGTDMGVSADAPALDMAYKLVEYDDKPRLKLSSEKVSLIGKKQVFRESDADNGYVRDLIGLRWESPSEIARTSRLPDRKVTPILVPYLKAGRPVEALPSLLDSRDFLRREFARLPAEYKALENAPAYPVELTPRLSRLQQEAMARARLQHSLPQQ